MTRAFTVNTGARIPHDFQPPPSAWNPLDIISATVLPPCLGLTEANRLATRNTVPPAQYEAGVRGVQSRGGVPGEVWYIEQQVVSVGNGIPSSNQGMQIGLIDARATNILTRPPTSDASEITNLITPAANYALAYSRLDGVVYSSELPSPPTEVGSFGSQMAVGDVYGWKWVVGDSITITRNGTDDIVAPFPFLGPMFPYFSAGQTYVDATNLGSTEASRICTGRTQQLYRPPDANYWG